jgi:hypothetical protein
MVNKLTIFCFLAVFALTGCATGMIYTNTITPYSTWYKTRDHKGTPIGTKECTVDDYTVRYYATVDWTVDAILQEAKQAGMNEIDYIDLKTLNILGVFQHKYYIVHGE